MISSITKQVKGALLFGALLVGSNSFAQLGLSWGQMGPNDAAGRTRSIIVDNADASGNSMFAAGVSGGVFRSSNAGANWTQVNDQAASLIVSCMAQDAAGNLYIGTGETFGNIDGAGSSGFLGSGLFKLNASSSTFTQLQTEALFGNVNEVAVVGTNTVYVAADFGFFISTDGGLSFTEETISATSTLSPLALDVKIAKNGDVYYSSYAVTSSTSAASYVYYCPAGSNTFTNITPPSITSVNRGRIEIAPSPVDANYVYLSVAKVFGDLAAVLVSDNKGTSWATITIGSTQFDPFLGGGNYSNTIVADPIKAGACYLGSYLFYRWEQLTSNALGQGTWSQIATPVNIPFAIYIHSYVHDVKFNSGNNSMYIATDGGIFKSVSNNTGFLAYNKGFNVAQTNCVAVPNFPRVTQNTNTLQPTAGIAAGSTGSGLIYLPGYLNNDPMTSNLLGSGDVYQSDFSKIIPRALFYAGSYGTVFRTNDIDAAIAPSTFYDAVYKAAATGGPGGSTFANEFTPFRLWEQWTNIDSTVFYNEIITASFVNASATKVQFTNTNVRPQIPAKYDTIIVVSVSTQTPALPTQTIKIMPVYSGTAITSLNVSGDTPGASSNTVFVNSSLIDSVRYTFTTPPNNPAKITLTYKLRYAPGDVISIVNTDISGNTFTATTTLTVPLVSSTSTTTALPTVKVPLAKSARICVGIGTGTVVGTVPSLFVVKRPLNFALNPDWIKIAGKNSRIDGPGGVASTTTSAVVGKAVTRLEWAPGGNEIYFSTKQNDTTFYLYRVSHIQYVGDLGTSDYTGVFSTDIDSSGVLRKNAPQRTTVLGRFKNPITGLAITADNANLMVMCGGYYNNIGTVYYSNSDPRYLNLNNTDASNFSVKNGSTLPLFPAYTGIFEMNDNKRALIGTEKGVYSTLDITAATPAWTKESGSSNEFPNVPVLQLRQQTLPPWLSYNSGSIYAATHGRGVWSTDKYFIPYAIGIQEQNKPDFNFDANIKLYPNPAGDATNLWFTASGEASYKINVYDINGRLLIAEKTQKLIEGEQRINLNTAALTSGMYFVTVEGSNNFSAKTKLVITK